MRNGIRGKAVLLAVGLLTLSPAGVSMAGTGVARVGSVSLVRARAGTLLLASQTPWVSATGSFDLRLVARRITVADLDLVVTVHDKVRSRSEFVRTMQGRLLRFPVMRVSRPLDDVPADSEGLLSVSLPIGTAPGTDPSSLPPLRAGVYPVAVALQAPGGEVVDQLVTYLVRLPDGPAAGALEVAWVQPVSAPVALQPDGELILPDDTRAGVIALAAAVARSRAVPMTLDVTPDTAAALGATELSPLRGVLDDTHPLLAAPYVDVDPSALVAAGRSADLAVQRQVGDDILLAVLGRRGDPRTWSAERTVTSAALAGLRSLGVTRLIVPDSALAPLGRRVAGPTTLARPFSIRAGGDTVVEGAVADAGLAAHFRSNGDQVLAAYQFLADLAVLFFDAPGSTRGVVVRPSSRWQPSAAFLGTVLPALAQHPVLRPVSLDQLFADVRPVQDDDGDPEIRVPSSTKSETTLPGRLLSEAHRALTDVITLTGPDGPQADATRRRLLAGEADGLGSSGRTALLASAQATFNEIRGRLRLPSDRTFRFTAREGTIPLTVINDNPFPVRIDLDLSSEKLDFTDGQATDRSGMLVGGFVLQPGANTRTLRVRARASGTFSLRAALLVPGGPSLLRSQYTIRSTVFSGAGVLLSIGAGVFLLLWWGRHWRTVRRARRLVDPLPE